MIAPWISASFVERLGWLLVHSVWQFAALALVGLLLDRMLRGTSAAVRYGMLLSVLAVMIAAPCITLAYLTAQDSRFAVDSGADRNGANSALVANDQAGRGSSELVGPDARADFSDEAESGSARQASGRGGSTTASSRQASSAAPGAWRTAWQRAFRPWLGWIVGGWVLGVTGFALRPILGWRYVRRLRRVGVSFVPSEVASRLQGLARRLRVKRGVQLLQSSLVAAPVLIGYLRPLILVPAGLVTGLPADQLQAILAHELAHVRRQDYLVNLVQSLIETIFFYHPAVWWLSAKIRDEREHCCDDIAVAMLDDRVTYGRALLALEELRGRTPALVLGAGGRTLLPRVQRLLGVPPRPRGVRAGSLVATSLVVVGFIFASVWTSSHARDRAPGFGQNDPGLALGTTWPQRGGSSARNHVAAVSNLPLTWNLESGQNVAWRAELGSQTYSSPVVAGGRILIGTNNQHARVARHPAEQDLSCLLCFDEPTGEFVWQYSSEKLDAGRDHDWPGIGLCSTPCVIADRVWLTTNRGEVVCLDLEGFRDEQNDGPVVDEAHAGPEEADVVWRFDMLKVLGVTPRYQSCSCVTVVGELVLLNTAHSPAEASTPPLAGDASPVRDASRQPPSFLALDRHTGHVVWSDNSPGLNILGHECPSSSPCAGEIDGVWQAIFAGGDGWLYAFDLLEMNRGKTQLLWKFDGNEKTAKHSFGAGSTRNIMLAGPVIHDQRVYVPMGQNPEHGEGPGRLWCIDPTRRGDISPQLVFNKSDPNQPIPHKRLQACVVEEGDFTRPNPNSGVVWQYEQEDTNGDGKLAFEETMHRSNGSVTIHDGLAVVADVSGLLTCLDAKLGRPHWTHDLFSACWSTPVIAEGKIFVADEEGNLVVLRLATKKEVLATNPCGASIYGTPALANRTMYVATRSQLLALKNSEPLAEDATHAAGEATTPEATGSPGSAETALLIGDALRHHDADFAAQVDPAEWMQRKRLTLSPDRNQLALVRDGELLVLEVQTGDVAHREQVGLEVEAIVWTRSGLVILFDNGRLVSIKLPVRPQVMKVIAADGSAAPSSAVVEAHVGYLDSLAETWQAWATRDGSVSLEGLAEGTHWLLIAGAQEYRTVARIELPLAEPVTQRPLRRDPKWTSKDLEFSAKAIVDDQGEAIQVEIRNRSLEPWPWWLGDLSLTTDVNDKNMRVLSPEWLGERPETLGFIEPGRPLRARLDWEQWVRRGLWAVRDGEPIDEPALPPAEEGTLWVRVQLGNVSAVPVLMTHPTRGLAETAPRERRNVHWVFTGGDEQRPLPGLHLSVLTAEGAPDALIAVGQTDEQGVFERTLPVGNYHLRLSSDREFPYLPATSDPALRASPWGARVRVEPRAEANSLAINLLESCELVLRAVDVETGEGIPHVRFYTENAAGEYWADDVRGDNLGYRPQGAAEGENHELSDQQGYFRRGVGPHPGYVYGAWTPQGYRLAEGEHEVELDTSFGKQRVEHVFRFQKLAEEAGPASAPTICGLDLSGYPSTLDKGGLPGFLIPDPDQPGRKKWAPHILSMPIYQSNPYATLDYPVRSGHFFVSVREGQKTRTYGPIDGDPFDLLGLDASMHALLRDAVESPNDALLRLRQLLHRGDDTLCRRGFSMVQELPVPDDRRTLDGLIEVLEEVAARNVDAQFKAEADEALEQVRGLKARAVASWESRRVLLDDAEYAPGNNTEPPLGIVWGEPRHPSGLQVGFSLDPLPESQAKPDANGFPWQFGDPLRARIFVRSQGDTHVNFTSSRPRMSNDSAAASASNGIGPMRDGSRACLPSSPFGRQARKSSKRASLGCRNPPRNNPPHQMHARRGRQARGRTPRAIRPCWIHPRWMCGLDLLEGNPPCARPAPSLRCQASRAAHESGHARTDRANLQITAAPR